MDNKYEVGQILYLVMKSKPQVIPVQVSEHIMRKTLLGIENKYVVNLPGGKSANLGDIPAEVFTSNSDTFDFMYQNAKSKISEMMEWCEEKITKEFKESQEESIETIQQPFHGDEEFQIIDFGDGQVGKIKIGESK